MKQVTDPLALEALKKCGSALSAVDVALEPMFSRGGSFRGDNHRAVEDAMVMVRETLEFLRKELGINEP